MDQIKCIGKELQGGRIIICTSLKSTRTKNTSACPLFIGTWIVSYGSRMSLLRSPSCAAGTIMQPQPCSRPPKPHPPLNEGVLYRVFVGICTYMRLVYITYACGGAHSVPILVPYSDMILNACHSGTPARPESLTLPPHSRRWLLAAGSLTLILDPKALDHVPMSPCPLI